MSLSWSMRKRIQKSKSRKAIHKEISFLKVKTVLLTHMLDGGEGLCIGDLAKQLNVPQGRLKYYLDTLVKTRQARFEQGRYHYGGS